MEYIAQKTKKLSQQTMEPIKFLTWQKVTAEEFKAYLGFLLLMGLVRMREVEDY